MIFRYPNMTYSSSCLACPSGRVAPEGSISSGACVNPAPNFVFGFFTYFLTFVGVVIYIFNQRFERIAFLREKRVYKILKESSNDVFTLVNRIIVSAEKNSSDVNQVIQTGWYKRIQRNFKIVIWFMVSLLLILLFVIMKYVFVLGQIIYSSMIIWRGLYPNLLSDFLDKVDIIRDVFVIKLNLSFIGYALYPFTWLIKAISQFNIDLTGLGVTCTGAQAPMQLAINCFVLGFIILVIESNF